MNFKVNIYSLGTGFTDDSGIYHKGNKDNATFIKTIDADLQDYDSVLLYKEYHYTEEVSNRMFCNYDENINYKNLLKVGDSRYIVKKIITWDDDFMEVMLFEDI